MPTLAPYLIDRIEIGVNGSPTPIQTIQNDEIMADLMFYTVDQIGSLNVTNGMNMSSDYQTPTAISTGASCIYIFQLLC